MPAPTTLSELITLYLARCRIEGLSPRTQRRARGLPRRPRAHAGPLLWAVTGPSQLGYNRDDCLSTLYLRNWLEGQRAELERELGDLPRPTVPEPEEREDSDEQKAVNDLAAALCIGLPDSIEELDGDERGRWLLAQLLNWHRREAKSFWWRYFYLVAN